MRTTQIAQYALRLTYSQGRFSQVVDNYHNHPTLLAQAKKCSINHCFNNALDPANREKMMSRSAVVLAALGLGLSTFSVRQMIIHQSRRI